MTANALSPAGLAVHKRLSDMGKSQQWLADEMNRRRAERGRTEKVGRATLWRWMTAKSVINVDDATLIEAVTGVRAILWSQYAADVAESSDTTPPLSAA